MAIDLENASIRLYEDISLTDELDDQEAQILLKWGAQKLAQIVQTTNDEELFEQQFKTLRQLMKRINRMIGQRTDLDDEQLASYLEKFVAGAHELGYQHITSEHAKQLFQQLHADASDAELVQHFIDMLDSQQSEEAIE